MAAKLNWSSVVLVIGACCASSIGDTMYEVTSVGGDYVYAMALNEKHEVVGHVKPHGSWSEAYAFLWSSDAGLQSLQGYRARDINEVGQIAGDLASRQAAVWENGDWVPLAGRQNASAINDIGQVAGLISAGPPIPGPYAPYRDDDIHSPDFIELTRPYVYASHGFDINNRGEVVADCGTPNALYVGVFYLADESYVILDNDGNYDAHARALNDRRQIVGHSRTRESDHLAVFWESPHSPMEYMGALGNGDSIAYAINDAGQAVGLSSGRAFLWSKGQGMVDLNAVIDGSVGITLTLATDINDNGDIVAWGIDPRGQESSYLLTTGYHATRDLSKPKLSYCPGTVKTVRLVLKIAPGSMAVGVEDSPPPGWVEVDNISGGGVYDPGTHKVKWGPFFAPDFPGELTYDVTPPPPGIHGLQCFAGEVSVDGINESIDGDECIADSECQHIRADGPQPTCDGCADCACAVCEDRRVEMCEMTGYACSWKSGCNDDLGGVTRAAYIWVHGEYYCWDYTEQDWVPTDEPADACGCCAGDVRGAEADDGVAAGSAPAGSATARVDVACRTRRRTSWGFDVTITIDAPWDASAMALEMRVPPKWHVASMSDGGEWDVFHRKVKWGPFLKDLSRTVSFTVHRPRSRGVPRPGGRERAFPKGRFTGRVSFDGVNQPIIVK